MGRRKVLLSGGVGLLNFLNFGCRRAGEQPSRATIEQSKKMLAGRVQMPGSPVDLPYRVHVPPGYSSERKYPLVLFMHSAGARGSDNISHLTQDLVEWTTRAQAAEPAFIVAPQCPLRWQWVPAVKGSPFKNYDQDQVPENEIGKMVRLMLDEVRGKYPLDPERFYITGASMGAVFVWDFITRYPDQCAAAIPCVGVNDPSRASVIADLPIWTFHGALDPLNPVENTREMVSALRKLGSRVRYTEYPDLEHNCWNRAYATDELYKWLFVQRRGRRDQYI